MKVPLLDLKAEYAELRDEILPALDRVCKSAAFVLGEEVEAFEREFAAYCGTKHCVALSNGTAALHLGLLALGVQPGDEVITSPNTFLATAESITYCGARPVLVDIDLATANLDPELLQRAISPRTRAIMPVHLYGRTADMDAIRTIAAGRKLCILEDAAQAHGARYRSRRTGGLADAAGFSFYPTKNLGAYGEGGALTTNDDQIANFARAARSHGQTTRYEHEFVGHNYRMHGFQGAVLRIKLRHLDSWTVRRQEIAREYRRLLAGARVEMPVDDPRDECVYHQFVIYVKNRDAVVAQLAARGIETAIHYPRPVHLQPAYSSLGYPPGTFPMAERACGQVLSLPIFPGITEEQINYVVKSVLELVGEK
ncbi:MAG TPA: DegT/DnrJ/EryC1/StrS family aminotransferase [Candidatus Limnocylindria bacterium]|nr:DegT/DnrJ/EryC1/StrS family aminotransferase [Candidatus Limnocylindria bacterium]